MGVVISWTHSWSSSDDGTILGGADLGHIQTDVAAHSHTSGVSTFLSLTDTPSSFASQGGKIVIVNTGETALEFAILVVAWLDYSAISTIVGWSSFTTKQIYVKKIDKTVFVAFYIYGVSNSASTSFTVPYAAASAPIYTQFNPRVQDNAGAYVMGIGSLEASGTTVTLTSDLQGANWTNSGTKVAIGEFWYESA